jgi:hypothetical protein
MIDRRQLSEALARLDPRDREVLDYSLRRHVPDSDLAAVFDCGPSEVARMRAAAVERLADDLGVQRGTDLGQVLTALLDHATWADVPHAEPLSNRPASPPASPVAAVPPAGATQVDPPGPADGDGRKEPVLGMLDRRGRPVAAGGAAALPPSGAGGRRWTFAVGALIAVLIAIGLGSVIVLGDGGGSSTASGEDNGTRPFEPKEEQLGEPFPSDPEPVAQPDRYPIAIIDQPVTLLDAPLGEPVAKIAARTEWDSPRVLSIVERQGDWLAVLAPELENGQVGWIQDSDVGRLSSVGWALKADLRTRTLEVERDGETIKTIEIGIGREDHPTPLGRFAVTDKLKVTDPASPYGCCVVALTGHQTKLPEGWPGGDRLAIHATNDVSGLGEAVSLGCMRTDPEDARWLMDSVPLGTPVFIEESEPPAPKPTSRPKPAKR